MQQLLLSKTVIPQFLQTKMNEDYSESKFWENKATAETIFLVWEDNERLSSLVVCDLSANIAANDNDWRTHDEWVATFLVILQQLTEPW